MQDDVAYQLAMRSRLLTLGSLPALRAWDHVNFKPTVGQSWVEEIFEPLTSERISYDTVEVTLLYTIEVYCPANKGLNAEKVVRDITQHFPAGLEIPASNGDVVRVRGDVGRRRGEALPDERGFIVVPAFIPCRVYTTNS